METRNTLIEVIKASIHLCDTNTLDLIYEIMVHDEKTRNQE